MEEKNSRMKLSLKDLLGRLNRQENTVEEMIGYIHALSKYSRRDCCETTEHFYQKLKDIIIILMRIGDEVDVVEPSLEVRSKAREILILYFLPFINEKFDSQVLIALFQFLGKSEKHGAFNNHRAKKVISEFINEFSNIVFGDNHELNNAYGKALISTHQFSIIIKSPWEKFCFLIPHLYSWLFSKHKMQNKDYYGVKLLPKLKYKNWSDLDVGKSGVPLQLKEDMHRIYILAISVLGLGDAISDTKRNAAICLLGLIGRFYVIQI